MTSFTINNTQNIIKFRLTGGTITQWSFRGKEVIPKFHRKKNSNSYRGGMPICFPFFGPSPRGMEKIPQHGWLRNSRLKVKQINQQEITFFGKNTPDEVYKWKLNYSLIYKLKANCLKVKLITVRTDDRADKAPLNPAFHPYFSVKNYQKTAVDRQKVKFSSEDYGIKISNTSKIKINTKAGLVKMATKGFSRLWLWSDFPNKYICLEPVLRDPKYFNTTKGFFLKPQEKLVLEMILKIES